MFFKYTSIIYNNIIFLLSKELTKIVLYYIFRLLKVFRTEWNLTAHKQHICTYVCINVMYTLQTARPAYPTHSSPHSQGIWQRQHITEPQSTWAWSAPHDQKGALGQALCPAWHCGAGASHRIAYTRRCALLIRRVRIAACTLLLFPLVVRCCCY